MQLFLLISSIVLGIVTIACTVLLFSNPKSARSDKWRSHLDEIGLIYPQLLFIFALVVLLHVIVLCDHLSR